MALRVNEAEFEQLYTVEEFEQLPEFNDRYDLIDGRLVKRPMPSFGHSIYTGNIRDAFRDYDNTLPESLGMMGQEASVVLGRRNVPTPDGAFWKNDNLPPATYEDAQRAAPLPDLAIEVHSPSDLKGKVTLSTAMIKVKKLLAAGVPIVWVIYPNLERVDIYHSDPGFEAGPVASKGSGEELDGEDIIPGFVMSVDRIFKLRSR